jgi:hypothetical protein
MRSRIALAIILFAVAALGQVPTGSDMPLTREWTFVWVDDEPASAHEHNSCQVFGWDIAAAVENFRELEPDAIVICAARAGDAACPRNPDSNTLP